jgi:ABC-2 type transport system ATP-binding protein
MEAVLTVDRLRKRYRRHDAWAVDGATLAVHAGEVFGLLGPNGAGKTTIVKMAAGLLFPDGGQIRLFGQDPRDAQARARLGFAPEDPDFPKFLRADEVLDYYARLLGIAAGARRARIDEALAWADLSGEKRQVRHFSKGMRQRLGLAQAILGQPALLVLDEPTADLDPMGRRDVRELILRYKAQGVGVLLNSHLLSEVERVCDTVAIIHKGRLLRVGALSALVPEGKTLEEVFIDLVQAARSGTA